MQSKATSVEAYLAELPADRRSAIEAVRKVIRANLDRDIEEGMQYGMIGYYVPHRVFPAGYHCDPKQPLPFAALASQKQAMSLYLMSVYGDEAEARRLREAWAAAGKKLDMGKSCIRFKKLEDLPLDVVGALFKRTTAKAYIERYERTLAGTKAGAKKMTKKAAKKVVKKQVVKKAAKKKAVMKKVGARKG